MAQWRDKMKGQEINLLAAADLRFNRSKKRRAPASSPKPDHQSLRSGGKCLEEIPFRGSFAGAVGRYRLVVRGPARFHLDERSRDLRAETRPRPGLREWNEAGFQAIRVQIQ